MYIFLLMKTVRMHASAASESGKDVAYRTLVSGRVLAALRNTPAEGVFIELDSEVLVEDFKASLVR